MNVKLAKWQKGDLRRIYFNHESLGNAKAYACSGENDQFLIRHERRGRATVCQILNVAEAAAKIIEEKINSPIGYSTKFADVWSATGDENGK